MPILKNDFLMRVTRVLLHQWVSILAGVLLAWGVSPANADTITLNSGEVLDGRILSETDTQLVIEASFYNGTILSTREVAKSDIRSISRETPEQKQEKADYAALGAYVLTPDQELTKSQYDEGIAAFEKFLAAYTNSSNAADINHRLADWQAEASNVAGGKVKFAGTWMTPGEKKVQAAQAAVQSLKKQLADAQTQRAAQAEKLASAQKELADAQSRLASVPDASGSGSGSTGNQGGRRDLAGRVTAGVVGVSQGENMGEPVSNPDRSQAQAEVNSSQQRVTQEQGVLTLLDAKIADLQSQIPPREQQYKTSLAQSSGTTSQSRASAVQVPSPQTARTIETNASAKTAQPPAPATDPTPSWYMRAWKWFHG
jgi:hypothetical protein